jgi:hypothetical protein
MNQEEEGYIMIFSRTTTKKKEQDACYINIHYTPTVSRMEDSYTCGKNALE